jgi:hypothetical protein
LLGKPELLGKAYKIYNLINRNHAVW